MTMAPGGGNSFQLPESEKPGELQLPANALSISGGPGGAAGHVARLAVAAADGSVAVYGLPEISLQVRCRC
jgi:hypothetical protein